MGRCPRTTASYPDRSEGEYCRTLRDAHRCRKCTYKDQADRGRTLATDRLFHTCRLVGFRDVLRMETAAASVPLFEVCSRVFDETFDLSCHWQAERADARMEAR